MLYCTDRSPPHARPRAAQVFDTYLSVTSPTAGELPLDEGGPSAEHLREAAKLRYLALATPDGRLHELVLSVGGGATLMRNPPNMAYQEFAAQFGAILYDCAVLLESKLPRTPVMNLDELAAAAAADVTFTHRLLHAAATGSPLPPSLEREERRDVLGPVSLGSDLVATPTAPPLLAGPPIPPHLPHPTPPQPPVLRNGRLVEVGEPPGRHGAGAQLRLFECRCSASRTARTTSTR